MTSLDRVTPPQDRVTPHALLVRVADQFDVSLEALTGRSRQRYVSRARMAAAYLLRLWFPQLGLQAIGDLLGGRDHTTVMNALAVVPVQVGIDPTYGRLVAALLPPPPQPPTLDAVVARLQWHTDEVERLIATLSTLDHPQAEALAAQLAACCAAAVPPCEVAAEVIGVEVLG